MPKSDKGLLKGSVTILNTMPNATILFYLLFSYTPMTQIPWTRQKEMGPDKTSG